ncbi:MAG: NAD-dependent epimerase/dehydratase family protein [Saprospiraceae bacterium]
MSKILITGGAGFIGSHLAETLANQGNEVVVLDNLLRGNKIPNETLNKITLLKGDVIDNSTVSNAAEGCDYIYHLAAILGVDIVADNPTETMEVEVIGMKNVAAAALMNNSKIIYASTSGIYGHNAIEQSVTEDIMVDPRTSYAMAKRYNELYLAALHEEKGLDCIALRYFNVYGVRQDNRMVTPRFIEQALANEPITVFGDGNQTRDFTYIDDTIKATILVGEKVSGFEILNVANENEENILNLAKKIISITGSTSEIAMIEAPKKRYDYEVGRRFGNSDKLLSFIGYKPDTDLDTGLSYLIQEYK